MFIVGLNGSPNKEGNTAYLLEQVLETCRSLGSETQILHLGEVMKSAKTPFCTACSSPCSGACFEGTEVARAFELIKKADGLVFGSPCYFGTVSAQMKAFFDKTRGLRGQKALYNKVACAVTVGASKYGGQETTARAMHDIMMVHGMIVVGDGFIEDDCGHHGAFARMPASEDENGIARAKILGKRLVEVCECTRSVRK